MKMLRRILCIAAAACVLGFSVLEGIVLAGCHDETGQNASVMIVLGAKLWNDGPSPALKRRLDAALDYWEKHPETEIILSGGQGADEPNTEASAMAEYMKERGVSAGQLHLEENSTSTAENLLFSMELMSDLGYDISETPVLIVSNSFHLARVRMLCRRFGLSADTIGVPMPDLKSAFFSYNREAFALVKSFFMDRPAA